jgi:hypothetical protein
MMSEQQKVFASLSGAVIAHILLLILVALLMATSSSPSAFSAGQPQKPEPREVTILVSDLMEKIKVEPPEPEPEPELPPESKRRNFFPTDTNQPEPDAPENATFYSDRNTSAATELLPDPNLPQQVGPTTARDAPIPYLRLQNREYVDGELNRPPATQPQPAASAPEIGNASAQSEGTRSGVEDGSGERNETIEGADLPPENPVAEERTRPPVSPDQGEETESARQKSFSDPDSKLAGLPEFREGEADRFAAAMPETTEAIEGEVADLPEKEEQRSGVEGGEGSQEVGSKPKDSEAGEKVRPGDVGLFADGFSAFQRQNATNGTLSNIGQNAVDAEETAAGKYEAAVRAAVAKKWHQYRSQNGDFVTYGFLKLRCRVDRHGNVHDLEVVENKANAILTDFSLRAILDADVPAMPEELAREYGPKGLELNYDIIIY